MRGRTLFKRGKQAGAMLQWRAWTEGPKVYTEHGQVGGKLQVSAGKEAKAKNVGAANATTPEEQATKEVEAAYRKRIDRGGYRETMAAASTYLHSVPMLAHKYEDKHAKGKVDFPVLVQPKLDGLRCLAYRHPKSGEVVLQGRKVTFYTAPQHIVEELDACLGQDEVLDGELYSHGVDLADIGSYAKKYRKGATERLGLHCYDFTQLSEQGQLQEERHTLLQEWFADNEKGQFLESVSLVDTFRAHDHAAVEAMHARFASQGYEGAIIRTLDHDYEFDTRSHGLLKLKDFVDHEFEIVAVGSGEGKAKHWPVFTCSNPKGTKGKEFTVLPKGTDAKKRAMLKDATNLIGKMLTVRFHQWSPYGQPEQPRGIAIREDI